ncbi:energy transducer TonB [bacterium]|nr:energy transducer TonB [bacterium]
MTDIALPRIGPVIRMALAIVLTAGLLLFLVVMRSLDRNTSAPTMTLRTLATTDPVSLPAPPPPPSQAEITPPTPPVMPDLPTLDLQLDSAAPPVKANLSPEKMDMNLSLTDFATASEQPRQRMTFAGTDLDSKPRLVYRPTFTFPDAQKKRGITQARVTLEVAINSSGKVRVLRVLDSPHPDFTEVAKSFAARSKFTSPIKDGRSVNTVFKWPLDLVL